MVEETTDQLARAQRRAQSLADLNRKMSEQLAHVPELPAAVTGGIAVSSAAATSYLDGYMTKPDAKPGEEEMGASLAATALGAGVAMASGKGKIKDSAIAMAEGAAAGLAARKAFSEGQSARIKHEAARAREKASEKG